VIFRCRQVFLRVIFSLARVLCIEGGLTLNCWVISFW